MNRIRKINNKYEILITPNLLYQTGLELMLGNWTDKNFDGFRIEYYNSIEDAINILCNYPELNFDQLVLYHREIYNKLFELILKEIQKLNINEKINIAPKLMNSKNLQEILFNRVKIHGNKFRLLYNMTDIISFNISCKKEISDYLINIFSTNQALRILYKSTNNNTIKLVGQTDIGTTYEINITNL